MGMVVSPARELLPTRAQRARCSGLPSRVVFAVGILITVLCGGCGGQSLLAPVESRDGYGPAPPGYYRILRGDTLMGVSRRTGHSLAALADWNNLDPPYRIYAGRLLRVQPPTARASRRPPPRDAVTASPAQRPAVGGQPSPSESASVQRTSVAPAPSGRTASVSGISWQWPLQGAIKQTYAAGDSSRQGVRIQATPGASVGAAAAGSVVYSGSGLKGYGNLIIVKHNEQYLSVYGFNRRLLVKQGEKVSAGQRVAEAGQAPSGEHLLHFEIRRDGATVDPLGYLPKR